MSVTILVCMANNRCIGRGGKIPWNLKTDLQRFKEITMNQAIIMGSKTFESIGVPLPNRSNIVLSRDKELLHYDNLKTENSSLVVVNRKEQALVLGRACLRTFIIGGEEIYKLFIDVADEIYLSILPDDYEGDVFFPELDDKDWRVINTELVKDELTYYKFVQLKRIR